MKVNLVMPDTVAPQGQSGTSLAGRAAARAMDGDRSEAPGRAAGGQCRTVARSTRLASGSGFRGEYGTRKAPIRRRYCMAEADPAADNTTAEGKAQNRRVAVNILVSKAVEGLEQQGG